MKKIILLFIILLTISCKQEVKPGKMYPDRSNGSDGPNTSIRYFKDDETNKCFAERGLANSYSFTCVECDSLVLVKIKQNK